MSHPTTDCNPTLRELAAWLSRRERLVAFARKRLGPGVDRDAFTASVWLWLPAGTLPPSRTYTGARGANGDLAWAWAHRRDAVKAAVRLCLTPAARMPRRRRRGGR